DEEQGALVARRLGCEYVGVRSEFDACEAGGAGGGFAALEKHELVTAFAEAGDRSRGAGVDDGGLAVDRGIEKILAFDVGETKRERVAFELESHAAALPNDDGTCGRIARVEAAFVREARIGRGNEIQLGGAVG